MSLPSPEQIAYMLAHADDDVRSNIVGCVTVCAILSVIFVGTRLFARWLHRNTLLLADYLIIFALCLYIPFCVALGLCTASGLGKHVLFVTDARLLQIYFISSEIIYSVIIVTIKWSILAFYQRIFPQHWFRWALLGVAVFMGAWMFTTVFAISFQCIPIEYNWDTTIAGGHCINIGQLALVTSILNVLTDVAILVLPLPLVWRLNVTPKRRWGLIVLFALGGGACVVGITRAGYIGDLNATVDPTWDNVPAAYLSAIEVLAGFLVACIPSYPVLFRRAASKSEASKQSGPSSGGPTPGGSGRSGESRRLRPVMSWNRITNTDDIELSTQTQPDHRWEPLSEEKDPYYRDGDHASTRGLTREPEPGVAL
ncbi:hypothetical protein F4821DRAFT_219273 [Hypoxylon rubiginosum]|uniref:Uncharacterized protein n=1 Tax=Hypoxylon rubiginosum TaxID=110542 RepID=A0ACC0CP69_9PEZI|nr:hypothetical protein F4821DRAFT_219273 [Hypoxylon rubiginosum]